MDRGSSEQELWEEEVVADHRWGRFSLWFDVDDHRGSQQLEELRELWKSAQPFDPSSRRIVEQIRSVEICNWNLERSILALCGAIGKKEPTPLPIGHMSSVCEERWRKLWAYYYTLRNWLPHGLPSGYQIVLGMCDPESVVQNHIMRMLGEGNDLKKLYVLRFCLCLERWLGGYPGGESPQMKAHDAAVSAVEEEIRKRDPHREVVPESALIADGDGRLEPCNHKAFRRYDIILSSIGSGTWRAAMPVSGVDGFDRAATLEKYLSPIESWIRGVRPEVGDEANELIGRIYSLLGGRDPVKVFLASLLVSLLRSQQLAAVKLAETRAKKS